MAESAPARRGCSLRPKKGGGWVLRWRDFEGVQRQLTFTDRRAAEREQARIKIALQEGRDPGAERAERLSSARRPDPAALIGVLGGDVASAYLDARSRRLAPRTLHRYGESLDLLRAFLEQAEPGRSWTVADLDHELLTAWWSWLVSPTGRHGRPRKPETARKHLEVGILLWRWAAEHPEHRAHVEPPREIELPRRPRRRPQAPTWAEYDRMLIELAATAPAWVVRLAVLARFLGERRSALLRLRWDHIDLADGRIVIPDEVTKGGYGGREVPIAAELLELLRRWSVEPHDGRILAAPVSELDARGHVDRTFKRAWLRAGVRESAWRGQPIHGIRKLIRSYLISRGVVGEVVDLYLGHTTPGTGARDYTVAAHLWAPLVAAAALLPPLPEGL